MKSVKYNCQKCRCDGWYDEEEFIPLCRNCGTPLFFRARGKKRRLTHLQQLLTNI